MWVTIGASRVKRKAIKLYSSRSNLKSPVQAEKKAFKFPIDQMTQPKKKPKKKKTTTKKKQQQKQKKTTTTTTTSLIPQSPQITEEDERYKKQR